MEVCGLSSQLFYFLNIFGMHSIVSIKQENAMLSKSHCSNSLNLKEDFRLFYFISCEKATEILLFWYHYCVWERDFQWNSRMRRDGRKIINIHKMGSCNKKGEIFLTPPKQFSFWVEMLWLNFLCDYKIFNNNIDSREDFWNSL